MKIYVLTKGCYSDYHIVAVTTDLENAKKLAKRFTNNWEEVAIEEYEDLEYNDLPIWYVGFKSNGDVIRCTQQELNDDLSYRNLNTFMEWVPEADFLLCGRVYVAAETEEAAIKIAAEKRAEYLAKKEGV